VQVEHQPGRAARGGLDGPAAVAGLLEVGQADAGGGEHFFARNVRGEPRRLLHASVDDEGRDARLPEQVADEGKLDPLGVERTEENNRHDHRPSRENH
jgi:hypothetical protein